MSTSHQSLNALGGSLLAISTVVVGLRFASRHFQKARVLADDWTMLVSYAMFLGFIASVFCGTYAHSLGYSTPQLAGQPVIPQKSVITNRALYVLGTICLGTTKASALLFFQRVFCIPGKRNVFWILTSILLVLTVAWTLVFMFLSIFQCGVHFSAAWSGQQARKQFCSLSDPYLEAFTTTDCVLDGCILLLPIPKIYGLKTGLGRRLGVILVFSTATVALGASIAKTVILFQVIYGQYTTDPLLMSTQVIFMFVLENGFAIAAINMPTLIWLCSSKTPERMLSSVRSFLSVNSRSRTSQSGKTGASGRRGTDAHPQVPEFGYQGLSEKKSLSGHHIHVTKDISQTFESV